MDLLMAGVDSGRPSSCPEFLSIHFAAAACATGEIPINHIAV
jgi:hypothetical protein